MPLPQLNTQGVDIGNTIVNIQKLKTMKLERDESEKRKALLDESLTPEAKARRNAILEYKEQTAKNELEAKKLDLQTKQYDYARKGLVWAITKTEAGDETAYDKYRSHLVNNMKFPGTAFPTKEFFYDIKPDKNSPNKETPIFNKERFSKWGHKTLGTASEIFAAGKGAKDLWELKTVYGPDGQTGQISVKKGENYFPEKELGKGWSFKEEKDLKITDANQVTRKITAADGTKYTLYGHYEGKKFIEESRVKDEDKKDSKDVKQVTRKITADDGENYELYGHYEGDKFVEESRIKLKDSGDKTITPDQEQDNITKKREALRKIGAKIYGTDDDKGTRATNKVGLADDVKQYNILAEELGLPDRIEWSDEPVVEIEEPGAIYGTNKVMKPGYIRTTVDQQKPKADQQPKSLYQDAVDAINLGADKAAVKKRYKEITGMDLQVK